MKNHESFGNKTLLSANLYLFWSCCFGYGGYTFLGYDYPELYGANAQNTYRRIHKSCCSRPIHTKRCCWAVFLERIESRALEALYALKAMKALCASYAMYAKYANVLVEKRTLVEKSKIWNLKPNCIYSMQSIEQHYFHETEEQNSNGCKLNSNQILQQDTRGLNAAFPSWNFSVFVVQLPLQMILRKQYLLSTLWFEREKRGD